ncbi:membrane bound O-acyl transferase family-domain-containing protein [Massariosphaeria phaeospora]|uniref:Membrane bound O-acyl transferase family-domain-containing protein n=1 Tax=Massariosphaeria phaeospora TaxID=100035 RepID=A0A7C8M0W0_9PLEO|nr:membrane bound O-acyl transferase family-domain-containing protein [Massariosphaeria phaeospora]
MAPLDAWPQSHHDLLQHYYDKYERDIQSGDYQPFVYPWGTFGALIVIIYCLIPHHNRPWLKNARFLAFAWSAGFAAYSIRYTRARGMASALGLGIISAWGVVWIAAIMVLNDAQTDFQRIERTEGVFGRKSAEERGKSAGTNAHLEDDETEKNGSVTVHEEHLGPSKRHGEFAWQSYPLSPFIERLDWVLDVFCNFRGAGWSFRPSACPPPPKRVQEQVRRNSRDPPRHSFRTHAGQTRIYTTRRELLRANTKTFLAGYVIVDALKTFMNHDPYYWGLVDRAPPSYFPSFMTSSPTRIHLYRLIVSQFAVAGALQTIFSLGPIFFSGILGPSVLGARGEPWLCSDNWGSYSVVLDRGLAGWWSGWWHQTFRFAFEQPSVRLIDMLGMDRRSPLAKLLQLFVAFGLSGVVHACGSYTCAGDTRPLMGPMRFFLLQACGIFTEVLLTQGLRKTGIQRLVPKWAMRTFTFIYVNVWFYYTAGLLVDDFAKGGVWLFEPIPISVVRGLGFGVKGDGWWCWGGQIVSWHRESRWWRSGVAV